MRTARASLLGALGALALGAAPAHAAISYVASNSASTTTASLAITKPTGTTTGDVLVATVSGAGTNTISAPSGWTLVADDMSSSSTMRTLSYVKVATASEGTTYTFSSSAARNMSGGMIALRGANTSVPVDAVASANGASGNAVAPSVTTSAANEWVITSVAVARNTTFTPASGTTERYDRAGTSTSNEVATATQTTAGATGARTAVPATSTSNWTAHTIAIRDATTAGLSVSLATSSASFSASLDSGDATATWSADATVEDTRLSNTAGWQLQVTSTTMTTGTRSLATDATSVTSVSGTACDNNAPCSLPTNSVSLPVTVPAGTVAPSAVRFSNAAGSTGEGRIDLTTTFTVQVPQNAFSGTYSSTVTISVVSGP